MLYNPIWEKPSLDGFIDFLETKKPDEEYFWSNCNDCAIGQYLKSIGRAYGLDVEVFSFSNWEGSIAGPLPHTFGGALERARKHKLNKSCKESLPCR